MKETLVVAGALALLLFVSFWILPFDKYFGLLSAVATLLFFGTLFANVKTEAEKQRQKEEKRASRDRYSCVTPN